jgi:hypothetical protein
VFKVNDPAVTTELLASLVPYCFCRR